MRQRRPTSRQPSFPNQTDPLPLANPTCWQPHSTASGLAPRASHGLTVALPQGSKDGCL
jgi:hypothetical protein